MTGAELFRIESNRLSLSWCALKPDIAAAPAITSSTCGLLRIKQTAPNPQELTVIRPNLPPTTDLGDEYGPHLFEQTDYVIRVTANDGSRVELISPDPQLIQTIGHRQADRDTVSLINYRSQVGYSDFAVMRDGVTEFKFTVEVFPSKLEYRQDFDEMLADVQEILTGLALEYLKATYNLGSSVPNPDATGLEWLVLLKSVTDDLERALQQIARHPVRGLRREATMSPVEHVRRVDSTVRGSVRRGSGSGEHLVLDNGLVIRRMLPERKTESTLDTPEHRWIAAQINRICQRVAQLRREESLAKPNSRRQRTIAELDLLEARMRRLATLEPLAAAEGTPPAGFSSLLLQGAPGYREAFQKCIILMLGLRIEGGPLNLSTKDVSELYEYWCFIALLRLVEDATGTKIPAKALFRVRQQGLSVMLERGKCTAVPFDLPNGRSITVEYNPSFKGDLLLASQRPDIVLTLKDPQWPGLKLVLDAKYRIDTSAKYQEQYSSPGPPEDALNVLHRYRDAILVEGEEEGTPKRATVQAAALFPYRDQSGTFKESRLWKALNKIGIGAVPLLPGDLGYLSDWLRATLRQGGWSIAESAIGNVADRKLSDWRQAAAEAVLVAALRGQNPREHLEWIKEKRCYYMPIKTSQRRFHELRGIAIYSPIELQSPGAIGCWAKVEGMEVKRRREIETPWEAKRGLDEYMFVWRLGEINGLDKPVANIQGTRISSHRWTTRLGLLRSTVLQELSLETEPEWRLYEAFKAEKIEFVIEAGDVKIIDRNDPAGRAWFLVGPRRIQYRGASGFFVKQYLGSKYLTRFDDLLEEIRHNGLL